MDMGVWFGYPLPTYQIEFLETSCHFLSCFAQWQATSYECCSVDIPALETQFCLQKVGEPVIDFGGEVLQILNQFGQGCECTIV